MNKRPLVVGLGSLIVAGIIGGSVALALDPAPSAGPVVHHLKLSGSDTPTTTVPAASVPATVTPTTTAAAAPTQAPTVTSQVPAKSTAPVVISTPPATTPAVAPTPAPTPVAAPTVTTTTVAQAPTLADYPGQYAASPDCPAGEYIVTSGSPIYDSGLITFIAPAAVPGDFCVTLNQ